MTQPPPHGQPGPYDQQPWGGYPPQNPAGAPQQYPPQQPQQQPSYGYPQPQSHPDPYGQQQPGQFPYGQYGQQPVGQPGPPPQKKKNTGLIVGLTIVGVLLIGGGITVPVVLLNEYDDNQSTAASSTNDRGDAERDSAEADSDSSADIGFTGADSDDEAPEDRQPADDKEAVKQVTEGALQAMADFDFDKAKRLACEPDSLEFPDEDDELPEKPDVDIDVGEPTIDGDHATVPIEMTALQEGETKEFDGEGSLRKEDGEWCLANEPTE